MSQQHTWPPAECEACETHYDAVAGSYHPESDVGPWDDACPDCGHIGGHTESCRIDEEQRAVLAAERAS